MGPNMLIMAVSYRDQTLFARPIYDLAGAIGAANVSGGLGSRSVVSPSQTTVRTRKRFIARQKYTTSIVQIDPPGFGSLVL
jgi:hypothetical protein